ncbi:MAG: phosphoribosyltransferase family protein, partial [Nitriliruptoraceae bacterium]
MSHMSLEHARIPAAYRPQIEEVLIPAADIAARLDQLAARIDEDYSDRELLLVGVLKGAIFVVSDLHRRLSVPAAVDFMAVSSYGSATTSSGVVRIMKDL